MGANVARDGEDIDVIGRINLVDHHCICHPQIGFAGVVGRFMTGAMGINHHDVEIRLEERHIVVATIPNDYVSFLFGGSQDALIIDTGKDNGSHRNVRFVFLHLFDSAFMSCEIIERGESLHGLGSEIAVWHRMAYRDHSFKAKIMKVFYDLARGLAFATAGADCACGEQSADCSKASCAGGLISLKSAPAASTLEARCITYSCETSEYENVTTSISCS